jgi:hypothetical protein
MLLSKYFIILFSMHLCNQVKTDFCGKHAILSETDQFYISQPFKQELPLDFKQYIDIFSNLESHMSRFENIAKKYSTEQLLADKEPLDLIPYTPSKNLFKVTAMQKLLPIECQKQSAQLVGMEPKEKSILLKILKEQNLTMVPFFTLPMQLSIYSPTLQILDNPEDASVKMPIIASKLFPYLQADGSIFYPTGANGSLDTVATALCSKPNNYWDRPLFRNNFINTLKTITNSFSKIRNLKETISKLPNNFKSLAIPPLPLQAARYLLSVPPLITKIRTFFQKFNNVESWESSTPGQFQDFISLIRNVKTLAMQYKTNMDEPASNTFTNYLTLNKSITVPIGNAEHLLRFFKLDPDHFSIDGPIQIHPVSQTGHLSDPSAVNAIVSTRIYDKTDLLKIHIVKPLIFNNSMTTVSYVIGGNKFAQASSFEPTPFGCSQINDQKVCKGFQTPGTENSQQHNLLACGRALTKPDNALEISKCPLTTAPNQTLAYRSECVSGVQTVVLSSTKPVAISTVCDNMVVNTQIFNTFPSFIDTECEIKLTVNEVEKTLLPQLQADFFQQQQIGRVFTEPTPLLTTPPPSLQLTPVQVILISTIGAAFASISVIFLILAIFDPKRCFQAMRCCCCLFHCFGRWCNTFNCQNGHLPENEIQKRVNTHYYPSGSSIATAPPPEQEMVRFLPQRSPYVSRRSSINDIRRADSVEQVEVEPRHVKQPPTNPTVNRYHPK